MGIALRRLNLGVAEELADHRQRHAARNEQGREGVAKVMDADGGQFGLRPAIVQQPLDVLMRPNATTFLLFETRRFRFELELPRIVADDADFTFGKAAGGFRLVLKRQFHFCAVGSL